MNEITIRPCDDTEALARLIAAAFADVAARLSLTPENCSGHTAYLTADEVKRGIGFGNRYFLARQENQPCGAVAMRLPQQGVSIIEKVAVLPPFRGRGIGRLLVEHALTEARHCGAVRGAIGIIASQIELRAWYENVGFAAIRQQHYPHLPFDVLHMEMAL
jgi:GNAT superfamily N-acetyltransferase